MGPLNTDLVHRHVPPDPVLNLSIVHLIIVHRHVLNLIIVVMSITVEDKNVRCKTTGQVPVHCYILCTRIGGHGRFLWGRSTITLYIAMTSI